MSWLLLAGALAGVEAGEPGQVSPSVGERAAPVQLMPESGAAPRSVDLEGLEVVGRRGSAPMAPETEFGAADIDALNAYDIGEVISRTGQTLGSGSEPVILVNGRRVANPGLYSGLPPDALARLEVLPREAAALYGGDPGRRVLNLVLQRQFESRDGRIEGAEATAGGFSSSLLDLRRSAIAGESSNQAGVRLSRQTSLRAGEREPKPGGLGGGAVTLRPETDAVAVNLLATLMLAEWSGTLGANGMFQRARTLSLAGDDAAETVRRTDNLALSAGLSGQLRGWALQLALSGRWAQGRQAGPVNLQSTNSALTARFDANRTLTDLPAGPLVVNLSGETARNRSTTELDTDRSGRWSDASELAGALSVPLSRRTGHDGAAAKVLGDVSVTLGTNYREGDGVGGRGLNTALAWAPVQSLRLNAAWSTATEGLASEQRFGPRFYGAPIVVHDFQSGAPAEVTPIRGGNPDLRTPTVEQLLLGVSAGPYTSRQLTWSASYARMDIHDGVSALPAPTPQLELAFADRFHRDGEGQLTHIDQRPINIRSAVVEKLSTNISLRASLPASGSSSGNPDAFRIAINHAWQISNAMNLIEALPVMDRLAGDGGGVPRQELSILIDGSWRAWGLNAVARWQGSYRVRREIGVDGPEDLRIAGLATVDLKLIYRIERAFSPGSDDASSRRGIGLQLELGVDNLLDARPSAVLGDGRSSPSYGRNMQDPVGRTVRVALNGRF